MYNYEEQKSELFREKIVVGIIKTVERLRENKIMTLWDATKGLFSDSFNQIACIDFLEEHYFIKVVGRNDDIRTQDWLCQWKGSQ